MRAHVGNPFPARLFPKPTTVRVTLWTTGTQGEKTNRVWHTLWNSRSIYRFLWYRPNSTTGMSSEHVMKIQQLTCQQTISVALVFCMYAKGKFSNGPLYLGSTSNGRISLLCWQNSNNSEGPAGVSFFQFLMSHRNWRSATTGFSRVWLQDN
jgi:hypothetical protein